MYFFRVSTLQHLLHQKAFIYVARKAVGNYFIDCVSEATKSRGGIIACLNVQQKYEIQNCLASPHPKKETTAQSCSEKRQQTKLFENIPGLSRLIQPGRSKLCSSYSSNQVAFSCTQVRVRELQDNIKFVENQDKISELDEKINEIKEQQESVGDISKLRR